jgi:hypothetical protein
MHIDGREDLCGAGPARAGGLVIVEVVTGADVTASNITNSFS